jgi:hypothetical protein
MQVRGIVLDGECQELRDIDSHGCSLERRAETAGKSDVRACF